MSKRVLVTGGSRGIGAAIATSLAREGHRVVLTYRQGQAAADEVVARIEANGGCASSVMMDVTEPDSVEAAYQSLALDDDPFQIVVNSAGCTRDKLFATMKWEDWSQVMRTTLDGFYHVTKPLLMPMVRQRWGRIVNVSSISGILGHKGQVNYSAAKAGLIGATKALAREVARKGVTVNAVAPGFIDTQMLEGLPLDTLLPQIPAGRLGTPEEVSDTVRWLCSDGAGYVTGQVLCVDGGVT